MGKTNIVVISMERDATPPVIAGLIISIPSARTALPTFGTAVVLFP